jgi:hypothetical protein
MDNDPAAPRRRRKPASPRTRGALQPKRSSRTPPEQPAKPSADDGSAVRPREWAGRSPDVIWPESGPEAALELLRQWEAEGLSPDVILPDKGPEAALELLRQWREEGDAEEQRRTGELLMRALDEDRLSYRRFRP